MVWFKPLSHIFYFQPYLVFSFYFAWLFSSFLFLFFYPSEDAMKIFLERCRGRAEVTPTPIETIVRPWKKILI